MNRLVKASFPLAGIIWMCLPQLVFACAACFGRSDSAQARGSNAFVYSLLGITIVVLGGFLGFIFYLWKRSKMIANGTLIVESDEDRAINSPPCYTRHSPAWHLQHSGFAAGHGHGLSPRVSARESRPYFRGDGFESNG